MYLKAVIRPQRHKLCWRQYESKCKCILTCERPLIVPTVVLCLQISRRKSRRHQEIQTNPTATCQYLSERRLCLHLIESEKQYYMSGDTADRSQ